MQAEDLALIAARIENRKRHSPWRAALERFIVLALLIAVIGAAFYLILPSASVEIRLKQEEVFAVVDIIADSKAEAVNLDTGVIPAQTLRETVETSAAIPTSGRFWLDSVTSAGVVTFTNLEQARVTIPAGTILATSAGEPILFETAAEVVVPGGIGRNADATVQAREGFGGSIGNVGAGMINTIFGALAESVTVINLTPVAGGGNRSVKVVAREDMARLRDSVRLQLQSLAFEIMRANLSDNRIIIIESIRVEEERKEWTRFSADIGTMTSELSLTMRAVVSALAVDERYIRQIGLGRLKANLAPGQELVAASLDITRGPFALGGREGQARFTARSRADVAAALDLNALRDRLAGLSLDEATDLLASLPELSSTDAAELRLYPQGIERMPSLPVRIDLRVKDQA